MSAQRAAQMTEPTHPDTSLHYRSPSFDADAAEIVVTVPTFRRPQMLARTLASIANQDFTEPYCVVVIENDAEKRAGAEAAKRFLQASRLPGLVLLAHQRGNCHAYNAGWRLVRESFTNYSAVAVIDDDEEADPRWLSALCGTAQDVGADIVGGPQVPVFETGHAPLARHPVFAPPYETTGLVPILYSSGNVLIARQVLESMPMPFLDPAFNFIGGGDSDFYSRAREHGFFFAWCAEAPVYESIPARRTTRSWLSARGRREGAISALIENRRRPGFTGHMRTLAKSFLMLAAAPLRALRHGFEARSALHGMYYIHAATGRLGAEFGQINEQYRNPEAN